MAILGDAQGNTDALVDTLAYTVAEVRLVGYKRAMRTSWWTLADTLAEVEAVTLGDARGDVHALVGTPTDTVPEVEAVKLGDPRGDAHALVNTLAETLAELGVVKLGDTRGYAHALVDTLAIRGGGSRRHIKRCACAGRNSG